MIVAHRGRELLGNLFGRDDCSNGVAIAQTFANGHNVGNDVVLLKAPDGVTEAAQPRVCFVGDGESSIGPDAGVNLVQIPWRERQVAVGKENGLRDEGADILAALGYPVADLFYVTGIHPSDVGDVVEVGVAEFASIRVCKERKKEGKRVLRPLLYFTRLIRS